MSTQVVFGAPTGRPIQARPRDPWSADTIAEFKALYEKKYHKPAGSAEIMNWYEAHPEAYEARFSEPFPAFRRRCNAVRASAEAASKAKRDGGRK
jgi:hypothetical protein